VPLSGDNINTTMHPDANDAILVLTRACQGAGTTVQIMMGFAPKFRTPEDYIIGITYDIWEGGGLGMIESAYYAAACPVYTPLSVSHTAQEVTAGTRATLAEFPDRNLLADDVIIGAKRPGFYSSHRVRSVATHLGPGRFAPPSGRNLAMLTIADCLCRDNRIVEEWLVRDQAGIAWQVGRDPRLLGYELGRANPAAAAPGVEALLARWADANGQTVEGDKALATMVLSAMTAIWGAKAAGAVERHYDRSVRMEAPGSELHYGVYAIRQLIDSMIAAIPDGTFAAQHIIATRAPDRMPRVAVRWTYSGLHSGSGRYGSPTFLPLALLGISHFEILDSRIKSEWMLVDELSIYAQIGGGRG
jgi:predicted ester cyclase